MAKRSEIKKAMESATEAPVATPKPNFSTFPTLQPRVSWLQALVIIAVSWWIYWPALQGGWLIDDHIDIEDNKIIQSATGLWSIWFQPGSQMDYYPIKASVQWIQWHLWHNQMAGYHITNVALHIVGALLVWRLLRKFGLRLAWVGGLIFAVHPVMVESVAWIAELKNTLSLPPFLLAICYFLDYDEKARTRDYVLALAWFLIAMLCKTSMVMFPFVILLYAWWKRDRIEWSDLKVSAPFFAISLLLGVVTLWVGTWYREIYHPSPVVVDMGGFLPRMACAGISMAFYFWKSIWPMEQALFYAQWKINPPNPVQFLPWLFFAALFSWCWSKRAGWGRHMLLGFGFFVLNLTLFLGFIPLNYMRSTWVMDHFLYIPIIGLIGLGVAGIEQAEARLGTVLRPYDIGIGVMAILFLAWKSHLYAGAFVSEATVWKQAVQVTPSSWAAHDNLGGSLVLEGRYEEAIDQYKEAMRLKPNDPILITNLGATLIHAGRSKEAKEQLELAMRLDPTYPDAHYLLGVALGNEGHYDDALVEYKESLRLKAESSVTFNNMGSALANLGRTTEAIEFYERAIKADPKNAGACFNLGNLLARNGKIDEAIEQFKTALSLDPGQAEAHAALGNIFYKEKRMPEAVEQYRQALKLNPNFAEVHNNLGGALEILGQTEEALDEYERALRLNPKDVEAQKNLMRLQAMQRSYP